MNYEKKITLILVGSWVAVFAMVAVLFIDQQIKRDILHQANRARHYLENLEVLMGLNPLPEGMDYGDGKGSVVQGRAATATDPDGGIGGALRDYPLDRPPAGMEKASANGSSRARRKPSARKSAGTDGQASDTAS